MTDTEAFIQIHGGPPVRAAGNGSATMICKDGSYYSAGLMMCYTDLVAYGDPIRQLKWRVAYHQTLADDAEVDAKRLEAALRGIGTWRFPQQGDYRVPHYQPCSPDGPTMLATLRAIVSREQQAVRELAQQIAAARPGAAVASQDFLPVI